MLTKTDKLGFVKSYGINALDDIKNEQELTSQIESESSRIRNVHYRSRLKRCMKESSNFSRKKIKKKFKRIEKLFKKVGMWS